MRTSAYVSAACLCAALSTLPPTITVAQGVSSFNTRTGALAPASGDHRITQISGEGTAAPANTGTSGAAIPLLNGVRVATLGANTFGAQQTLVQGGSGCAPLVNWNCGYPVVEMYTLRGTLNPRSNAIWQGVAQPQSNTDQEINFDNYGYYGYIQYDAERFDVGTVYTNAATPTSGAVLSFAATPGWMTNGSAVFDATTSMKVGTVLSSTGTTVTLTANASSAVASGDVIIFSGPGNSAVQNGEKTGCYTTEAYDGTSNSNNAEMCFLATETQNYSTGHHGVAMYLDYTPNGAGVGVYRCPGISISNAGLGGVTVGASGGACGSEPTDEGAGTLNVAGALYADNGFVVADSVGHLRGMAGSFTPTVNNSGTVVAGSTDNRGEIAAGGTASTSWKIGWGRNWPTRPFCTVTPLATGGGTITISPGTASFGVKFVNAYNGGFDWVCL